MNKKLLFTLWGVLFVLCAGLGFLPEPAGLVQLGMTILSVLFFLPPALLLWQSHKTGDQRVLLLIRNLSALSLGLTLVALILTFITAVGSETVGTFLHYVLVVVSAPMICSGYWVLSLFLWACLLMASLKQLRKKENK